MRVEVQWIPVSVCTWSRWSLINSLRLEVDDTFETISQLKHYCKGACRVSIKYSKYAKVSRTFAYFQLARAKALATIMLDIIVLTQKFAPDPAPRKKSSHGHQRYLLNL